MYSFLKKGLASIKDQDIHEALILNFAKILRKVVPLKYFVGRFGGDEFIVIAEEISGREESEEMVRKIKDMIMKFNGLRGEFQINYACGYALSEDYPETAKRALAEMERQTGEAVFDENGLMKKGVIVRHLLLPGAVKNAKAVVKYVYETYGDTVWLSLMSQYTPLPQVENIPPLNRKTTKREYERLLDYTFSLGVTNAFLQEGPVAEESFIPEFDGRGI